MQYLATFIVFICCGNLGQSQRDTIFSFSNAINITESLLDVAYDYISWGTGLGGQCPFNTDIVQTLSEKLPYHIQCQDVALESIINVK